MDLRMQEIPLKNILEYIHKGAVKMIDKTKIFPCMMIALDIGSAAVHAFTAHDWRKTMYWIAAAVLNAAVTF